MLNSWKVVSFIYRTSGVFECVILTVLSTLILHTCSFADGCSIFKSAFFIFRTFKIRAWFSYVLLWSNVLKELNDTFNVKYKRNWCTVTVAPTIEHHDGHSRTPANQRWEQVPGRSQRLLLGYPHPPLMPSTQRKLYIWRLDTGRWPALYRKCHSNNTPGKRHNIAWVEPLAGNCTTSFTRQREQVWQNVNTK